MSFIENISAAVDRLGPQAVGVVLGIGMADWPSAEQRDRFLDAVTRTQQQ